MYDYPKVIVTDDSKGFVFVNFVALVADIVLADENIAIFVDSIPKGIERKKIGQKLFNAEVSYRFFPGATSQDFIHYIKPTFQGPQADFDIGVLHIGIRNILNLVSTAETVSNSILHRANQCKHYGVKKDSISSITCATLLNCDLINVNNSLRNKYQTYGYHFIDNNNIITEKLWKDGLHLTNFGKGIIINNHVQSLNSSHFLTR